MAPEKFPEVRKVGTTATFDFEPVGDKTRVTLTQAGWKQGKEWDEAYEYLAPRPIELSIHEGANSVGEVNAMTTSRDR